MGKPVDALAYSPRQAAEVLGCSRPFIYTLIDEGEIRPFKIKARTFIARSELEAFVERNLAKQQEAA
ncbi:helix-turn-helix domain-containing protein [[Pseudomonas] boreopolis]|uniref:helix-turn-helix domain-containing protein n=1 Tax=Xanthomonas boreopolis TaxID=86183 RepID=UPI003D51E883